MKITLLGKKNDIARIEEEKLLITDVSSALDLMVTVQYETKCRSIIIDKSNLSEDFFKLSSGVAGEILQKFVNYKTRLAIVGDFTKLSSKPLKDFIFESNKGRHVYFVGTEEEALEKLS